MLDAANCFTYLRVLYGVSFPAFAVESEEHSASEWDTPMLNHGGKWATGDLLRKKMVEVRETVTNRFNVIDKGQMTLDDYKAMGAIIEHQVVDIVAQCKLPASADATFHFIFVASRRVPLPCRAERRKSHASAHVS